MRHLYSFDYLFGGTNNYLARLVAKNASAHVERDTFENVKAKLTQLQEFQAALAAGRSARKQKKEKKEKNGKGYGGRSRRFVHLCFRMPLISQTLKLVTLCFHDTVCLL